MIMVFQGSDWFLSFCVHTGKHGIVTDIVREAKKFRGNMDA